MSEEKELRANSMTGTRELLLKIHALLVVDVSCRVAENDIIYIVLEAALKLVRKSVVYIIWHRVM